MAVPQQRGNLVVKIWLLSGILPAGIGIGLLGFTLAARARDRDAFFALVKLILNATFAKLVCLAFAWIFSVVAIGLSLPFSLLYVAHRKRAFLSTRICLVLVSTGWLLLSLLMTGIVYKKL